MKVKVYFAGILVMIAVFMIVVLGVSMVDSKAENRSENVASKEKEDDAEDDKEDDKEDDRDSDSVSEISEIKRLQDSYKELVDRYNALLRKTRDDGYLEDSDIKNFLDEMGDVITQLGEEDLENADESDLSEMEECMELMNGVLDEYEKQMDFEGNAGGTDNGESAEELTGDADEDADETEQYCLETADFTLTCWDGEKVKLSDQKGKKTIITFWATWCGPCMEELKALSKIREEYSEDELSVLAVNCGEGQDAVKLFCRSNGYTFRCGSDTDGSIQSAYGVDSIPQMYILDETGEVLFESTGSADSDTAYKEIKKILK